MAKKKWSEAEKKLIVLEILRGQKSVIEIAKEKGISDALVYRLREQALKAIDETFSGNGSRKEDFTAQARAVFEDHRRTGLCH